MSQVWKCDRCEATSDMGIVDDPPDDWVRRSMPVRGTSGNRSDMTADLCPSCDDDLYAWFHTSPPSTHTSDGSPESTESGAGTQR
jgi:hypothetical protein